MRVWSFASCALVVALAACDSAPSSDVPTSETGLYVDVAVDDGGRAEAAIALTADNPALLEVTYLRLDGGDQLSLAIASAAVPLSERTVLGAYDYTGRATGVEGGDPVTIGYDRADGEDATGSHGTVPAPFALGATTSRFSSASGLMLTFGGLGGADELLVSLRSLEDCFDSFTERGPGAATSMYLPGSKFVLRPGGPATCNVVVTARAVAHGTADPAFGRGGVIHVSQVRTLGLPFDR